MWSLLAPKSLTSRKAIVAGSLAVFRMRALRALPRRLGDRRLGASVAVNAGTGDPVAYLKKEIGGAHGVLVTAVSPKAFEQAIAMVRRGGTVSLAGLPPGHIFGMVLNGITVRGSIVGTRLDLQESLDFAAQGKVKATVTTDKLENINDVLARLDEGRVEGRVVLDLAF